MNICIILSILLSLSEVDLLEVGVVFAEVARGMAGFESELKSGLVAGEKLVEDTEACVRFKIHYISGLNTTEINFSMLVYHLSFLPVIYVRDVNCISTSFHSFL